MDSIITFECLPVDAYTHFDLSLIDLVRLTDVSTYIRDILLESSIVSNQVTEYSEDTKKWIPRLRSSRLGFGTSRVYNYYYYKYNQKCAKTQSNSTNITPYIVNIRSLCYKTLI